MELLKTNEHPKQARENRSSNFGFQLSLESGNQFDYPTQEEELFMKKETSSLQNLAAIELIRLL